MTDTQKLAANVAISDFVEETLDEIIEAGPNRDRVIIDSSFVWSVTKERSVHLVGKIKGRSGKIVTKWVDLPEGSEPTLELKHAITLVARDVLDVINKKNTPKKAAALPVGDLNG